jgi:hypothetical protein
VPQANRGSCCAIWSARAADLSPRMGRGAEAELPREYSPLAAPSHRAR